MIDNTNDNISREGGNAILLCNGNRGSILVLWSATEEREGWEKGNIGVT